MWQTIGRPFSRRRASRMLCGCLELQGARALRTPLPPHAARPQAAKRQRAKGLVWQGRLPCGNNNVRRWPASLRGCCRSLSSAATPERSGMPRDGGCYITRAIAR